MAFFPNRQTPTPLVSGRATVAHLNRAQQPRPAPISGRALVGQLGVGRRYTGAGDLLSPRQLSLPVPPPPDFYRLRADAQRLQQQLAVQDSVARPPQPAPPPTRTPAQAGYPVPFLSPAEQQRRRRERAQRQQQVLAAYNQAAQAPYLSPFLRRVLSQPRISLLVARSAVPTGPDCFMPKSFWRSQNPHNDPKVGWKLCCATVKGMVGYNAGLKDRIQIVREHGRSLVRQPGAAAGFGMLDKYLALHKPVMTGVNHTYGAGYNEGTTDHFIAIVGTGTDAKGKYYRFFDVGTTIIEAGTSARNRLYYDSRTGSYSGKSAVNGLTYTISQLRFKPGTF